MAPTPSPTGSLSGGSAAAEDAADDNTAADMIDMPHMSSDPSSNDEAAQNRRRSITFEERRWLDGNDTSQGVVVDASRRESQHSSGGGLSFHSAEGAEQIVGGAMSREEMMRRQSSGGSFHSAAWTEEEGGDVAAPLPGQSEPSSVPTSRAGSMDLMRGWTQQPADMMGESMVGSMGFAALGSGGRNQFGQDSIMLGANDAGPALMDDGDQFHQTMGGKNREHDDLAMSDRIGAGIMLTNEDKAASERAERELSDRALSAAKGGGKKKPSAWPRSKIFQSDDGRGYDEVEEFGIGASGRSTGSGSRSTFTEDLMTTAAYDTGMNKRKQPKGGRGLSAWPRQDSEDDLTAPVRGSDLRHEAALTATVRGNMRGVGLFAPLALIGACGLQLLFVPFFFYPRTGVAALEGPAWRAITVAGVPLLEGLSQIVVLLLAIYLSVHRGSVFFVHLLRHASLYLLFVSLSYVVADGAYFQRYGNSDFSWGGAYADGADRERAARLALACVMLLCSAASLAAFEKGAVGKVRALTESKLRQAIDESDEKVMGKAHSKANVDPADPAKDATQDSVSPSAFNTKQRKMFLDFTQRSICGYQVVAALFALRTTLDYLIRHLDEGAWAMEYLRASEWSSSPGRETVAGTVVAQGQFGSIDVPSDQQVPEGSAKGGALLILSLIQSTSAFLHLALLLAVCSTASHLPHSLDAIRLAALASFGRFLLSVGYAINLGSVVGGANNVDGFWSAGLTCLEMGCSLGMVYACAFLSGAARDDDRKTWWKRSRASSAMVAVDAGAGSGSSGAGAANRAAPSLSRPRTLRSIAFSAPPQLYLSSKRYRAKTLHLSSLAVLAVHTVQSLLLVGYDTAHSSQASSTSASYDVHPAVDATKFGMHICVLYALVNYAALWEDGTHYRAVRPATLLAGASGVLISGWQIGALAKGSAGGAGALDTTSLALMAVGLAAYLALTLSAFALRDVRVDNIDAIAAVGAQEQDDATALAAAARKSHSVRKTARSILRYAYLPTILAYALCVAIYEGRGGETESSEGANYPLINRAQDLPPGLKTYVAENAPVEGEQPAGVEGIENRRRLSWVYYDEASAQHQLDNAVNVYQDASYQQQFMPAIGASARTAYQAADGTFQGLDTAAPVPIPPPGSSQSNRVLAASLMSHVTPTVFLLGVNRPGLHSFFHYGLAFAAVAADGLRSRPALALSPLVGAAFALHGCVTLLGYLASWGFIVAETYPGQEEAAAMEGLVWDALGPGEKAEFLLAVMWLTVLVPLAALFVQLWAVKRKTDHTGAADGRGEKAQEMGRMEGVIV